MRAVMEPMQLSPNQMQEFKAKTGLSIVPDWAWERVVPMEEVENYDFYSYKDIPVSMQLVPLRNVVGTYHSSYNDRSWIRMLLGLERDEIKSVEHAYVAFDNPDKSDDKVSFLKYGENYIIRAGNHRTCFAKFGQREFVTAEVVEYTLDVELCTAVNFLKQYFQVSHKGQYYDFHSPSIYVMTCDRQELIAFYRFLFNWNYNAIPGLNTGNSFLNKLDDLVFSAIAKLFSIRVKPEPEKRVMYRWMKSPTDTNVLMALMKTKHLIESN